jgi:FAD/FMN-containing dehydrogenase
MTAVTYDELKQNIQGEISLSDADRTKYSRDASVFEILPEAIVYPKNVHDLQQIVKWASKEKANSPGLSLTMRAGGTDMTGGSINDSLILDTTAHMNHILDIGVDYAVAEPGVFYRDFEKATLDQGLLMPSYPASKNICALGGMVGNNAGGEKSLSFGQVVDYVQELEVVLADGQAYTLSPLNEYELQQKMRLSNFEGNLYRDLYHLITRNYDLLKQAKPTTSKNSSGYFLWDVWDKEKRIFDLTKLFVGSQGTLGLISKIKFRLVKPKASSQLLVIFLNDIKDIGHIVDVLKHHQPESLEIFDDHTLRLALKYLPEMIRKLKGHSLKLAWEFLPELWMSLRGGLPKLVLLAEFTGDDDDQATANLTQAQKELTATFRLKTHRTRSLVEAQKYWLIRRESYNLLRTHTKDRVSASFIEDIVVHPEQLPEFLPRLDEIFARHPEFIYTIAGHAGDANFHIFPLMDLTQEKEREVIISMSEEVYDLLIEFRGSMSAEHNDGLVRGPFLEKMFGPEVCALFRQTKELFDPLNIFNPHKKIDANLDFFRKHVRHN